MAGWNYYKVFVIVTDEFSVEKQGWWNIFEQKYHGHCAVSS